MPRALVIDDDPTFQGAVAALVADEGFEVEGVATLADARVRLTTRPADLVLLDLELPDGNGLDFLREQDVVDPLDIVLITGNGTIDSAIAALRLGAADYLTKPPDVARLRAVLMNAVRRRELRGEIASLRDELRTLGRFGALIGSSPPMQAVYDLIARVAPTDASVLVTGESGTGKELVAQTVHRLSRRRGAPFIPVNCGAISPQLIESELFGHERGSFTGASRSHKGYFERAEGGTIFLDEVTEMPPELQVRLLRVLENGTLIRVGGEQEVPVNVRIVAATNRQPKEAVGDGKLREDLLYRLAVFPIGLPPLRDRTDDIVLLAEHFLAELNAAERSDKRFTRAAHAHLRRHGWPGNVREMRNAVQRAFILTEQDIAPEHLPLPQRLPLYNGGAPGPTMQVAIGTAIAEVERRLILATLEEYGGDKERTARDLRISLKTLYNKLKRYQEPGG